MNGMKKISPNRPMLPVKPRTLGILVLCLVLAGWSNAARCQESRDNIQAFLVKMGQAYRNASYLGFQVKYVYANASTLSHAMDSITGEVEMDKGRSRVVIDGTETLVTERYAVHVVHENKLIYLSKPGKANTVDPIGMIDSVLSRVKGSKAVLSQEGGGQVLSISFPPGQAYSYVRMVIDPKTGWLERMEYDLHTAGLVGQEMIAAEGHAGAYESSGRVTVLFRGYRKGAFGDGVFDEGKFFTRTNEGFVPSVAYKDYQIFQASSNL